MEASRFLCFILASHDNTGNDFDDHHYIVDLFQAVPGVAVNCIGDELHAKAGENGSSTTETTVRLLEQFRSLERMIQRRSFMVSCALSKSLADIELAKLLMKIK